MAKYGYNNHMHQYILSDNKILKTYNKTASHKNKNEYILISQYKTTRKQINEYENKFVTSKCRKRFFDFHLEKCLML